MADIVLVAMPFVPLERPSLALSLLKAILEGAGLPASVRYASLSLAEEVGLEEYLDLLNTSHAWKTMLVGEWLFRPEAFEVPFDLGALDVIPLAPLERRRLRDLLRHAHERVPAWLDGLVEEILDSGARVVGCSSMFQQHVASLALLRRIHRVDPKVVTMLGGPNCEMGMGAATHRNFPWVDFVVSGEADGLIVPLCRGALQQGRDLEDVPPGVFAPVHRREGYPLKRGTFDALDTLPYPDFADYFEQLARSPLAPGIDPGLPLETSRGCWWGARHHCTFCGLNAGGMAYRRKSPARAQAEFEFMADRWGLHRLMLVDDILDTRYLDTLVPALRESGRPWNLFYEVKSNLRPSHLQDLAAAGVRSLQPGIESLHSKMLALMNKGAQAWQQVQFLKSARQSGIWVHWNILLSFPGEEDAWHGETAALVPLLAHLQPPYAIVPLRYDRFSPYFERREELGFDLVPHDLMPLVYPLPPEEQFELCYHFRRRELPPEWSEQEGVSALLAALAGWRRAFFSRSPAELVAEDDGTATRIRDTRPCAVRERHELRGLEREVHRACAEAHGWNGLSQRVEGPEPALRAAVETLVQDRLLLPVDGRWLALAVDPGAPPRPYRPTYPGGEVRLDRLEDPDVLLARRLLGSYR